MRTTLTIDEDVAKEIERIRQAEDRSLRDVVNDTLRLGLGARRAAPRRRKQFRTRTFDKARPLIASFDNVAEVIALVESDAFKWSSSMRIS